MIYQIEINYRKGPSFSTRVQANSSELAKSYAVSDAKKFGFNEAVKKVTAKVQEGEACLS